MAGISFRLDRLAREGGLRGIAGAACHGAVISSGPWLVTALFWTAAASLTAGTLLFGLAARMHPVAFLLATALMTLFAQIWVAGPFLLATRRYVSIFVAYLAGIALAALSLLLVAPRHPAVVLAAVCGGLLVTLALLLAAIREHFPSVPAWRPDW
jgi:polysaccharide biosynthesis protein PelG